MVSAAAWVMTLTVVVGSVLAFRHLGAADAASRPPAWAGLTHGLAGAAGLALLLLALRGPPRGVTVGAGPFGAIAAWLFGVALAVGGAIWVRRRRGPMVLILLHAGLAVTGWVLLVAWALLG